MRPLWPLFSEVAFLLIMQTRNGLPTGAFPPRSPRYPFRPGWDGMAALRRDFHPIPGTA